MKQINSLTDDSKQLLNMTLDDASRVTMRINYIPAQNGWFYSLLYGTFQVYNRRLVNSPNALRAFRQIIPFGLCCTVVDGYEPVYQDDFTSGRVTLYILNATDVLETETLIVVTLPNFTGYPLS